MAVLATRFLANPGMIRTKFIADSLSDDYMTADITVGGTLDEAETTSYLLRASTVLWRLLVWGYQPTETQDLWAMRLH
jgi:hypothetical protein